MKQAAFFDLDRTLLRCDSQQLLIPFMVKKHFLNKMEGLGLVSAFISYRLGLLKDPEPLRQKGCLVFRNRTADEIKRAMNELFYKGIEQRLCSGVTQLLAQHRQTGEVPVIVSACVAPLVERVARWLAVEHVIATELEKSQNIYTGRIAGKSAWGQNKAARMKDFAESCGIRLAESFAYADHESDIPMLAAVGHPIAVNPTRRLRKHAEANGWVIIKA